jgi:chromosome partitioning protein
MKIFTVASIKGGVGKSSLCINLAQHLAQKGRVLAIDTDAQNSMTDFFLRDFEVKLIISKNIGLFYRGQVELAKTVHQVEKNLDCIPSTIDMATIGKELSNKPSAIFLLYDALLELDYDFVVIDTPPAIDFPLHSAIMAAELILVPFNPGRWTMRGVEIMNNEIDEIERIKKIRPQILLIPYMVTKTENQFMMDSMGFTKAFIPRAAAIRRAIDSGKPVKEGSAMWAVFNDLTKEILEHE